MTAHDWVLVEAARTDRAAFADLYRAHHGMVYRFARSRVHHHELAEDITADTFVRALAHVDRVQDTGHAYGAWLLTITRNLIRDHWKASRTRYDRSVAVVPDVVIPTQRTDSVDAAVTLRGTVGRLCATDQAVLADRFLHQLSLAEVADSYGCAVGAVKARQWRAVRNLRDQIGATS